MYAVRFAPSELSSSNVVLTSWSLPFHAGVPRGKLRPSRPLRATDERWCQRPPVFPPYATSSDLCTGDCFPLPVSAVLAGLSSPRRLHGITKDGAKVQGRALPCSICKREFLCPVTLRSFHRSSAGSVLADEGGVLRAACFECDVDERLLESRAAERSASTVSPWKTDAYKGHRASFARFVAKVSAPSLPAPLTP